MLFELTTAVIEQRGPVSNIKKFPWRRTQQYGYVSEMLLIVVFVNTVWVDCLEEPLSFKQIPQLYKSG